MSITNALREHVHSLSASATGATTSLILPLHNVAEQIVVGTSTGVLIWVITKSIAWLAQRLSRPEG